MNYAEPQGKICFPLTPIWKSTIGKLVGHKTVSSRDQLFSAIINYIEHFVKTLLIKAINLNRKYHHRPAFEM